MSYGTESIGGRNIFSGGLSVRLIIRSFENKSAFLSEGVAELSSVTRGEREVLDEFCDILFESDQKDQLSL